MNGTTLDQAGLSQGKCGPPSINSMTQPVPAHSPLLAEVRQLIDAARQRVASAVNAELTQLYWHIGRRINAELLQGQRGEYGKQVMAELARQLTVDFGKGWSEQQLRHCLRLAEVFADEQILSTVWRELSWSHLKALIYIEDPLKRDFYLEICRVERWSVRQLQERINSLLFERTAISKKPEETIRQDLSLLRNQGQLSPDLTFRDPMHPVKNIPKTPLTAAGLRAHAAHWRRAGAGSALLHCAKSMITNKLSFQKTRHPAQAQPTKSVIPGLTRDPSAQKRPRDEPASGVCGDGLRVPGSSPGQALPAITCY